ncbi:alpha/beta fold hydrolase [Mycolicibacterium vanbaalenii]|uniref:alpha/beta fold hydrolase n=1 Tax=Mycolicibacterium TaxID=1866885 RepID=UPI0010811CED|nr:MULTISPECIES: alpha/beta fold hydrolase [Mycolicibacterium]TGD88429.1 alpha/beta fold hydrolase [Mycolicibacterium sp. CH28]UJL27388.1 alpha/beta fold hydrolase [Mycolicibacterium vanbaalenii]WND59524.1 alpha/beta fold hydrolase [Mycolicibacterium vanbaalenii]
MKANTDTANPAVGATVDAGAIRTNYLHAGDPAAAPVVLLHGSGPGVSAYANWRLTIPALAASHHVLAPDLVGFGYTQRPDGHAYTMDTWIAHIEAFLDTLGLTSYSLVGNSFGGALALRIATRHPDHVQRLVLMGSAGVPFPVTEGLDAVWGYQPSVPAMRRVLDYFAYNRDLMTDDLATARYQASVQPGFHESYAAMFPAPRQRWLDAMITDDDAIRHIPCPTLIVHGREDQVIPPDTSRRLFELIPNAELHMFGKCGHWTQIEHAASFNRLVAAFLADEQ